MKKTLSLFLAIILIIGMMPLQALAEATSSTETKVESVEPVVEDKDALEIGDEVQTEAVKSEEVTYPLTIKMYNLAEKKLEEKTFNSPDDKLGQWYKNAGRSDWSYRTFRKIFLGWSTDKKFLEDDSTHNMDLNEVIYRDIESISAIEGLNKDTELYPVIMPVTDLMAFAAMLETGGGTLYINGEKTEKDVEDEATENDNFIKRTEGFEDKDAKKRLIEYYFDPEKEEYEIQAVSEFYFKDPRVPFVIVENPLGIIKSAKGVTDFTGQNPQNYTYEDLIVDLDKKFDVAKKQEEWTFESSTFIVSDILDENYNSLSPTIALPNPDSLVTKFSFDNPNGLKKFIIRTTPRSDNSNAKYGSDGTNYPTDNTTVVTGRQILQPMKLKTGKGTNIKISKEYAKELEADKELQSISKGTIKGSVGINKKRMTGGAAAIAIFLPDSQPIPELKAKNTMNFDFAIPYVRFDKNTNAFGDTEEQNLGYSKFVVNKAIDSDGFNKDTKPNKDINQAGEAFISDEDYKVDETKLVVNGKELTFKGWNTKADGKGKFVKKDTVIEYTDLNQRLNDAVEEDITLYAIWESKEEPQPEPQPEPKPEPKPEYNPFWPIYFGSTEKAGEEVKEKEIHKAYIFGYTDKTVRGNGNLTRAEAAAMVTRLAGLDLSDKSKANYNDLQDGAWYLPNINAALKAGMIDATDNNLRPNDKITRGEFAKMLAAIDKDNDYVSSFSDIKGHKYEKEISKIDGNKRIEGYQDGTFKPDGFLTRAEAASFLNRMFNRVADDVAIEDFVNSIIPFADLSKNDWFYFEIVEATNTHELYRRGGSDKFERAFEKWTNVLN